MTYDLRHIVSNQVECKNCGDRPYSASVHDFKYCKCGDIAVDGGQDYLRRVGNIKGYNDLSISMDPEALQKVIEEVEKAIVTNRNSYGVTLAALRGIRDAGLSNVRLPGGSTNWEVADHDK